MTHKKWADRIPDIIEKTVVGVAVAAVITVVVTLWRVNAILPAMLLGSSMVGLFMSLKWKGPIPRSHAYLWFTLAMAQVGLIFAAGLIAMLDSHAQILDFFEDAFDKLTSAVAPVPGTYPNQSLEQLRSRGGDIRTTIHEAMICGGISLAGALVAILSGIRSLEQGSQSASPATNSRE